MHAGRVPNRHIVAGEPQRREVKGRAERMALHGAMTEGEWQTRPAPAVSQMKKREKVAPSGVSI